MKIIIRADASPTMGTGHVMRCLALAQWARELGIPCMLMGRVQVSWVKERLAKEEINHFPLLGEIPKEENPEELLQSLVSAPQGSWIVLDGYHFTFECQKAVRAAGHKLLVIDDYAHFPKYSCDILLNQNIGAEKLTYNGDIGQKFLGLEYVLLRQEFIRAKEHVNKRQFTDLVQYVLINFGGGSILKYLNRLLPFLEVSELKHSTLQIIAGADSISDIQNTLANCHARIEILEKIQNMQPYFEKADFCISAGGSTCWELCYSGVPFVPVSIAENQDSIVRHLESIGLCMPPTTKEFVQLLRSPQLRKKLSLLAKQVVSGKGVIQIFDAMRYPDISLRLARKDDCRKIFDLISDPDVAHMAVNPHTISIEEHTAWFDKYLSSKYNIFYLAFFDNTFLGYVRFEAKDHIHFEYKVSIVLAKQWRKKGMGYFLLNKACQSVMEQGTKKFFATIRKENFSSINIFEKMGFTIFHSDESADTLTLQFSNAVNNLS